MSTTEALAPEEESTDRWDPVREMPPSAKLVAKVLDYNETLTQSQLAEETLLPPRRRRGRRLAILVHRRPEATVHARSVSGFTATAGSSAMATPLSP